VALGKFRKSIFSGVFVHHPRVTYKEEWFTDDIERKLFVASWDSVKEWMEAEFRDALWVNRPSVNQKSRNVLNQLWFAESVGLNTPPTLFTNNFKELREFAEMGAVVIKQGNLGVQIDNKRILTSLIDLKLVDPEVLHGCPCLFQRYIQKQYELRVHVIGNAVLTCRIDSQMSDKTRIDWRNFDLENTPHEPYELDYSVCRACVNLVKHLGLEFGVIDMIVSPDGEYIFLECNAQGHWIWIEELTGLPITKVLCEYLLHSSG
jgi:glutathione synthase/RimK-type ligase-like ATP-grasp enzyme